MAQAALLRHDGVLADDRRRYVTLTEITIGHFVIQPHERLHDWIAHENGYFKDLGLDYEIAGDGLYAERTKRVDSASGAVGEITQGAYEAYERGKGNKGKSPSDISCACHWAVNQAAAAQVGKMWGRAYSVCPAAIMVREDSEVRRPEDLANREIAVGRHSGSHFTTIQALEPFLPRDRIKLKFTGYPWQRVDAGIDGDVPAVSVWGLSFYACEQLGMRKVTDATFMMSFMFPHSVEESDVEKYFEGLKRAQHDIDLEPESYKHYFCNELPERYRDRVDVRLFGPGERVVFLPYSKDTFDKTQHWIHERAIFNEAPGYDYHKVVTR